MALRSMFLSFWLVVVACTVAVGQYFPEQDASWEGVTYTLAGPQAFREVLCGQTVINGRTYSQFWKVSGEADTLAYLAAIRTNGPRVYYVEEGGEEERLLYDFSLDTGDTIRVQYVGLPGEITLKVASVAFMMQDTVSRKVVNFVPIMGIQEVWVEGVGSLFGPLNRGFIAVDAYSELFCQRLSGNLSYRTAAADACNFVHDCTLTGRNYVSPPAIGARVFPTVSSGEFQLDHSSSERVDARLFNSVGQCVWQRKRLPEGQHRWQFAHLPAGIYYLTLSTSNKNIYLQRFKLMITR